MTGRIVTAIVFVILASTFALAEEPAPSASPTAPPVLAQSPRAGVIEAATPATPAATPALSPSPTPAAQGKRRQRQARVWKLRRALRTVLRRRRARSIVNCLGEKSRSWTRKSGEGWRSRRLGARKAMSQWFHRPERAARSCSDTTNRTPPLSAPSSR